jgi:hypothetical protein
VPSPQRRDHAVDEILVVEKRVDAPRRGSISSSGRGNDPPKSNASVKEV